MTKNLQKFIEEKEAEFDRRFDYVDYDNKKEIVNLDIKYIRWVFLESITQAHNLAIDECLGEIDREFGGLEYERVSSNDLKQNIKKLKVGKK